MSESTKLADAFRRLRDAWFAKELRSVPQERVWEEQSQEAERHVRNAEVKHQYDKQTERIIAGEDLPICPRCLADMDVEAKE